MPRATRYLQEGYRYHLTHRCHDQRFLLRFAKERDAYREWLRVGAQRHKVSVLAYTVTCNHVHVLVDVEDRAAVAAVMQLAAGTVAQTWNRRKQHEGAGWEHPYHCTRIQDGTHLMNCLVYIDLNMVRAGQVAHPRDWRWCGHDEMTGQRKRYRVVDRDRLLWRAGVERVEDLRTWYENALQEQLSRGPARESMWTDAVAVGDRAYVEAADVSCSYRRSLDVAEMSPVGREKVWVARESGCAYGQDFGRELPV